MTLHAAQRRYLAEDLMRLRRSDEQRRYSAPQRSAKIDANPHQIDAVIFALSRIREGGCILADEVGLGKTIETGLVMAQLFAESARRVLLIAPKALLGQWRHELLQLFGMEAKEAQPRVGGFEGDGIFLIGREAAGSERGKEALLVADAFDLCVIDEAHELFAGIYKRFDRFGGYDDDSPHARTAARVRDMLQAKQTPVLLLTATPIQNNLAELWGLVQFVDPLSTLLGGLDTFREVFCTNDDRQVAPGQEAELRTRLRVVLQRTLRRQAQDFLEKPFVNRQAKLFEYTMSPSERALYDDITRYLLEPGIVAFQGSQRKLLLIGFHRRLASSQRALAASLEGVAARLKKKLTPSAATTDEVAEVMADLEEDADEEAPPNDEVVHDPAAIKLELMRIESFIERAKGLQAEDSKFRALLQAFNFMSERAKSGHGAGKIVIFTESCQTQNYLRERLLESRLVSDEEVTLFNGSNDSPRVEAAVARWQKETPQDEAQQPSDDIMARLALVHEFKTRSKIFISTEAGAKGLNLQFCDTLVNYDLPWNPQRIEQRIGRCHRYGQQHDVTVINFLAKDNEAQELTFIILSQKLELFGAVLDASDQVLHRSDGASGEILASALGNEFEAALRRIYDRARTLEEVTAELRALRDRIGGERARFEETHARAAGIIESSFDEGVRRVFRGHKSAVPPALAELDRDLERVVTSYLDAAGMKSERETIQDATFLHVNGTTVVIGAAKGHTSLHLKHPLVTAAVAHARAEQGTHSAKVILLTTAPEALRAHAGKRGRLRVVKATFKGFEQVEVLVTVAVFENGDVLDAELGPALMGSAFETHDITTTVDDAWLQDATDEALFDLQAKIDSDEHKRFETAQRQAERFVEDRLLVLRRKQRAIADRLDNAVARRDSVTGSEARTEAEAAILAIDTERAENEGAIERLGRRDDPTFQAFQTHIHQRRYSPPELSHLFDLTFELALVIE